MPGAGQLAEAYATVGFENDEFLRGLDKTQRKFERKTSKMRRTAQKFGRAVKQGVMVGIAGFVALTTAVNKTIDSFAELEKAQQQVFTLMDTTKRQFNDIADTVKDIGVQYGTMAKESNKALYDIVSASFEGKEAISVFEQANRAAIAGASDLTTASDLLTSVLNAYGASGKSAAQASDILFKTIEKGKVRFDELASKLGRVLGIAPTMGVSFEEVSATVSLLTRNGQELSKVVTGLRASMKEIAKPSEDLKKVIHDVGYESGIAMLKQEGFQKTLAMLDEEVEKQGLNWAKLVTNVESWGNILPITGSKAEAFAKDLKAMKNSQGATSQGFEKMAETIWFNKKRIIASFDEIVKSLGSIFAPAFKTVAERVYKFSRVVSDLIENNKELRESILKTVKGLLKIGAVITVAGLVGAALWALTTPIGMLMGLAAAFYGVWRYNLFGLKTFITDTVIPVFNDLKDTGDKVVKGIEDIGSKIGIDFDFDTSSTLQEVLQDKYGMKTDMSKKTSLGLRAAIFTAVWTRTGSFILASLSATIGVDFIVKPVLKGIPNAVDKLDKMDEKLNKKMEQRVESGEAGWYAKYNEWVKDNLFEIDIMSWQEFKDTLPDPGEWGQALADLFYFEVEFDWSMGVDWEKVGKNIRNAIAKGFGDLGRELAKSFSSINAIPGVHIDALDFTGSGTGTSQDLGKEKSKAGSTTKSAGNIVGGLKITDSDKLTALENLVRQYKGTDKIINKGTAKMLSDLIKDLENSSKALSDKTKNLLKTARDILSRGSTKSPDKKQKGGPMGKIPGYGGGDKVPALLEKGEFIWPKEMVKEYPGLIRGLWQGFSSGGMAKMANGGDLPHGASRSPTGASTNKDDKILNYIYGLRNIILGMAQGEGKDRLLKDFENIINVVEGIREGQESWQASQADLEQQWQDVFGSFGGSGVGGGTGTGTGDGDGGDGDGDGDEKTYKTEFGKAVQSVTMSTEELADAIGVTTQTYNRMTSMVNSVISSLSSLASATGELSQAEQTRVNTWGSFASNALQGNFFQAALGLITGHVKAWIQDMKKKRDELKKKVDTAFNIATTALREFGSALDTLLGSYLGPFSSLLSNATSSIGDFFKMTVAFTRGNTLQMIKSGFQGVLSITQGLISTFANLVEGTKAHKALQQRMDKIWSALGRAASQLLWPLVALADWAIEFLGIVGKVKEDMKDITEMNVPEGIKKNRNKWAAQIEDQPTKTTGDEIQIPQWAKKIIKPIKKNLKPILQNIKESGGIFNTISNFIQNMWSTWAPIIANKIPTILDAIQSAIEWLRDNVKWQTIAEGIASAAKWFFTENFEEAFNSFQEAFSDLMVGVFGEEGEGGGILAQLQAINDNLKTLAKVMGAGAKVLSGMAGGAAIGFALGGIPGAIIGAGLGAIGGWLFAEGGVAMGPTLGMVGEEGPEAVIPLEKLPRMMGKMTPKVSDAPAMSISLEVKNVFDGKVMNNRLGDAKRELNYKSTGDSGAYNQHGRNKR